jgi:hypothetical protein
MGGAVARNPSKLFATVETSFSQHRPMFPQSVHPPGFRLAGFAFSVLRNLHPFYYNEEPRKGVRIQSKITGTLVNLQGYAVNIYSKTRKRRIVARRMQRKPQLKRVFFVDFKEGSHPHS